MSFSPETRANDLLHGEIVISNRTPTNNRLVQIAECTITGQAPKPRIDAREEIEKLKEIFHKEDLGALEGHIKNLERQERFQQRNGEHSLKVSQLLQKVTETGKNIFINGHPGGAKTKAILITGALGIGAGVFLRLTTHHRKSLKR